MTPNEYYEKMHDIRRRYTKQGAFEYSFIHNPELLEALPAPRQTHSPKRDLFYLTPRRLRRLNAFRDYLYIYKPHLVSALNDLASGLPLSPSQLRALYHSLHSYSLSSPSSLTT